MSGTAGAAVLCEPSAPSLLEGTIPSVSRLGESAGKHGTVNARTLTNELNQQATVRRNVLLIPLMVTVCVATVTVPCVVMLCVAMDISVVFSNTGVVMVTRDSSSSINIFSYWEAMVTIRHASYHFQRVTIVTDIEMDLGGRLRIVECMTHYTLVFLYHSALICRVVLRLVDVPLMNVLTALATYIADEVYIVNLFRLVTYMVPEGFFGRKTQRAAETLKSFIHRQLSAPVLCPIRHAVYQSLSLEGDASELPRILGWTETVFLGQPA